MNRRELLKGVVVGTGAAVARQAAAAVPDPLPHNHTTITGSAAAALQAAESWTPAVFDAHQNDTVVALTELIIPASDTPGAKAALVNRYIDLILSEGPAEAERDFLQGLSWLDGYAIEAHGRPFVACPPSDQAALLATLDPAAKSSHAPADLLPGIRFFEDLKQRTAAGYYTSQIGFQELNKGGRVPASYGCEHDGH